ncbi:hypothetical protein FISHEDRAFT_69497 [Fistulina hepatica ATCC 64428]|uniref:Uncharacterized protein n=1 Tax=Fistulina hepatica ATCC 64428 TaxID=1128425 RepID=A0A0D7AN07_9AGAR|nr:hypothetical protein FISHEDRAFT_69497 [Fistulina hepatica ATCC 64428]
MDQDSHPWFYNRAPTDDSLPFRAWKKFTPCPNEDRTPLIQSIVLFPWLESSLVELWDGDFNTPENTEDWKQMIIDFGDAVAAGDDEGNPENAKTVPSDNVLNMTWALQPEHIFEPLLVITRFSIVHVFNVKHKVIQTRLRGHGGQITSISTHATKPNIFCTTSRDMSSRIYDLSLPPQDKITNNPPWPGDKKPCLAGPAHGLQMNEKEGVFMKRVGGKKRQGAGRCITVLCGQRSGGHEAAVLNSAFHPYLNVIATCGLDRTVKIWHLPPPLKKTDLHREDKPLFSSSMIHEARVLSVAWLSADVLITHSGPAVFRDRELDDDDQYQEEPESNLHVEAGTIEIWRWLSLDRFFPASDHTQRVLRGVASDYQESLSFQKVASYSYPDSVPRDMSSLYITPRVQVCTAGDYHPLICCLVPSSPSAQLVSIKNVQPIAPRPHPGHPDPGESWDDFQERLGRRSRIVPPPLPSWDLELPEGQNMSACILALDGEVIIAGGSGGSLWVLRADQE